MSLKIKTFFVITIAILIPAILTNLLIYTQSESSVVSQTSASTITGMNKAVFSFDSSLNALASLSMKMQNDDSFIHAVKKANGAEGKEKNRAYSDLYIRLNSILESIKAPNIVQDIDSLYLYLPNQETVITTNTTYYEEVQIDTISFLKQDAEHVGKWYQSSPINFYTLQGREVDEKLLTYNQHIVGEDGNVIGVYALNLNERVLQSVYRDSMQSVPSGMVVFSKTGEVLSKNYMMDYSASVPKLYQAIGANQNSAEKEYFRMNEAGREYLVVPVVSPHTGWMYVSVLETQDFLAGLFETKKLLILIIIMMVIATPLISIVISRSVFKPTQKLVHAMQEISNRNLEVRIEEQRKDEYQKVFEGFNNMVSELNELIQNLTNEKTLNKEARIRLLQEQINPHFLYNTLDSIYSIAQLYDVPEISNMVFALSQFFRVSLSDGKEIVCLSEALEIVKSYLTVQNIRFKGKFDFSVVVPDELLDCKVLKLLLQPLAENAIYHGLEAKKGKGTISITAHEDNGVLVLCIEDNGIGLSADKLQEVKMALLDNNMEESNNFAIKNLNTQIKLRYGNEYGIDIHSEQHVGTGIFIRIPIVK